MDNQPTSIPNNTTDSIQKSSEHTILPETTQTIQPNRGEDTHNTQEEISEEVKELEKIPEYRITPKYNDWLKYYTDKNEKETYGNATKSAIKAYNLDPVRQYVVARRIGSDNITKHHSLAREFLEEEGYSLQYMMAFGLKKMHQAETPGWWKAIMEYSQFVDTKGSEAKTVNIQNNVQNNVTVTTEEADDFNKQFTKFLESQPTHHEK
jgi:hypothetical protein